MLFNTTKTWRRKFEPRVCVWKLKEEKRCEEYQCMIKDKVAEAEWRYLDVNEHWQQMKSMMETRTEERLHVELAYAFLMYVFLCSCLRHVSAVLYMQ